jgi:hypothetical protein
LRPLITSAIKLLEKRTLIDTILIGIIPWIIGYPIGFYLITIPGYPEIMMQSSMLIRMISLIVSVLVGIVYLCFRKRIDLLWKYALAIGGSWLAMTIILDFFFIVLLFNSYRYYRPHIMI